MITLSIFNDFCGCWWLWWILPFLLGLALGWAIWAHWRKKYDALMDDYNSLKSKLKSTEDDLAACSKRRTDLENEIALLKGRIREKDSEINRLNADLADKGDVAVSNIAATEPAAPVVSSIAADPVPQSTSTNKYAKLKSDNLQIIEGIGPKMESVLHENGITSWAVLGGKTGAEVKSILDKYGDKYRIIDPTEWPIQGKLAADANWDGLIAHQKSDGSDSKAEKVMVKMGILKQWSKDDLKMVEGVGPKIEGLLHAAGIKTWKELAETSITKIQGVLDAAGDRYKLADPSTWPKQAELADAGKWDDLEEYQDFLQGGKNPTR